jgi:hypothetical protein
MHIDNSSSTATTDSNTSTDDNQTSVAVNNTIGTVRMINADFSIDECRCWTVSIRFNIRSQS